MLGIRVTPDLKARLQAASVRSGNSLSAEAEERLSFSFRDEDLLLEALDRIYGRDLAALLLIMGEAMRNAGHDAMMAVGFLSGKLDLEKTDPFIIGRAMAMDWPRDWKAYNQALAAALAILDAVRPMADPVAIEPSARISDQDIVEALKDTLRFAGDENARRLLSAIANPPDADENDRRFGEQMRARLAPDLLARIEARVHKGESDKNG
jgi:hypothetical protein